ncbi:MAG: hypothetical protein VYB24_02415, partial [Pseudomonadota bacterium]|nr:hypothetical protein [Pseudomonadota bacterium]
AIAPTSRSPWMMTPPARSARRVDGLVGIRRCARPVVHCEIQLRRSPALNLNTVPPRKSAIDLFF